MIEALKPCGDCAYILSAISKTSLAEKFRGAILKSPLKTRTWKVKEKNIKFDPELQNNYPEYRCHEQGISLSFCHVIQLSTKKEASFLGTNGLSCIYVRWRLKGLTR